MKQILRTTLLLTAILCSQFPLFAQSGSGWDWAGITGTTVNSPGKNVLDIANDASGNVYTTGYFMGSLTIGGITINTTGDGTSAANYDEDAFIAKYNSAGNIIWLKRYGIAATASHQRGQSINVDASGNVYVGIGRGFPELLKYDAAGNLVWNKVLTQYEVNAINIGPDGNLLVMTSTQTAKDIFKLDYSTGNILWTFNCTGIGSNSGSTFQDFTDAAGNIYFTAFSVSGGAVAIGAQNFSPTRLTSYFVSLDNAGNARWVQAMDNVQVQLSYTVDDAGRSYIQIGGGFGALFQGYSTSSSGGDRYFELNNSGTVARHLLSSPYKGLFRVKADGIYGIEESGASTIAFTLLYGNYFFSTSGVNTTGLGVVIKYDRSDDHVIWANSFQITGLAFNPGSFRQFETGPGGKVQVAGNFFTSVKFGSNTYTPTAGPGSNQSDFFLAQFDGSNVQLPPTTTWTGNSANGSWTDAGNWSNSVPNGNEHAIIPSGASNYPTNITTSNRTGRLTVQAGVSIMLPVGFDAAAGISNDGNIEVKGTGTFQGFNTSYVNILTGTGKLIFTANSPSSILYSIPFSLEINKPGGTIQWMGGTVAGNLLLTAGVLQASNPLTLTNPNAILIYSSTAYMTGTLTRAVNASGVYNFPVGGFAQFNGGPTVYAPVTITLNNISGPQLISATFPGFSQTNGPAPNINLGSSTITTVLNSNQWYVTANAPLTSGTYNIAVQTNAYTNGVTDPARYVLIKRAVDTDPYGFYGSNQLATQTGGTNSSGVISNGLLNASLSGLTSFSTFAIGIASAAVPAGLTIGTSNWTGNNGVVWNDAANWDNGIPNSLVNAIIPAGRPNYPQTYVAADNARSLKNDAITTVRLPYTFLSNTGIINNGSIEVIGAASATFNGFGNSTNGYSPLSGTGKLLFTVNSPGIFSGTFNNSIEVDKLTANLFAQNVYIGGSLNVISGNLFTSYLGNQTFITMLNPAASVTATSTYPVQGVLTRTVSGTGNYNYPLGETGGRFSPVTISTNGLAGTPRITAQYASTIAGFAPFAPVDGDPVSALNAGQWTITPSAAGTGGTFNLAIEARGYTNSVTDVSRYVLLKGDGSSTWAKVDNALFTQSAGLISVAVNNLPALTAQTVYIIGIKGATTQWTGSAGNQSWTTSGNWSNGVPDFSFKAVFAAGSANYPINVTNSNTAAMLTIAQGVTLSLPQTMNIAQGIINNGTINVTGFSNFTGFAGNTTVSGTGNLAFTSAGPAGFSSSVTQLNNGLILNRAGNFAINTLTISGNLILTNGLMTGNLTMTDPAATLSYTGTGYIVGTLKRSVTGSGTYIFPVGMADRLTPLKMTLNNMAGVQNITTGFSSTIDGAAPNTTAVGVPVTQLLNAGIWTITPNNQPTSGGYTLTLEGRGYTNGVANPARYVILRRDASFYSWGYYGDNGLSTEVAGVVTATSGLTGFLRQYAIGIASSAVGVVLPLKVERFSAVKKETTVLLQWRTANEVNSDRMIVQHSTDGISWKPVATVLNNNSSDYQFVHINPAAAANYYRLQLIDKDGKFSYSDIRLVKMDKQAIAFVYPNPATGETVTLDLGKQPISLLSYVIADASGKVCKKGIISSAQQPLSIQGLATGIYFLKISDGTVLKIRRN
ncbi:MAG: C-terminal target protein [Ferruginibacter sp.]|nr:C-terminal target protein [Ferruginibacter sp.]